jgi:hypothetical protein
MNLLDWFKQKITPKAVSERQTDAPRLGILHREFAGHPSKGLTPADLASILAQAEQGDMIAQAELFMDMEEKDAHIAAELSKRKMAVKKLDWTLEPPRDASAKEKKATKALELLIRDELDIDDIRLDMLDAIGHGYSCIELGSSTGRRAGFSAIRPTATRCACAIRRKPTARRCSPGAGSRTRTSRDPAIWRGPACTGCWRGRICSRTIRSATWPSFLRFTACRFGSASMGRTRATRKRAR